jgi:XTP/dITP diphosphohydrolase
MKLLFATANQHKALEVQNMLPDNFQITSLSELNLESEIPETADSIEGNAIQKVEFITTNFGIDCFADDTGLEIEALGGAPGIYSARYAGDDKNAARNMDLVLKNMKGLLQRSARFKTVIALSIKGEIFLFEGVVNGVIRDEKSGSEGFGYDPIFEPEGCGSTFSEMNMEEKRTRSHRARAFEKMVQFLSHRKGETEHSDDANCK